VRIETFEQIINVGAGRQFMVSKTHQRKARNRYAQYFKDSKDILSLKFRLLDK
jgi:hypothetical protein